MYLPYQYYQVERTEKRKGTPEKGHTGKRKTLTVKFREIFMKIAPKNDENHAKSQIFQNFAEKISKSVENAEILSSERCEGVWIF